MQFVNSEAQQAKVSSEAASLSPSKYIRKPLLNLRPVPQFSSSVTCLLPAVRRRAHTEAEEALETFQRTLREREEGVDHEELLKSLRASISSTHCFVNPCLEKNIARLDLLRQRSVPKSPSFSRGEPISIPKQRSSEPEHINRYYQHSSSSRAVNRLPLPGTLGFNIKQITARRGSKRDSFLTLEDRREVVLSLLPHKDSSKPEDRHVLGEMTRASNFHCYVRTTNGNRPESREGARMILLNRKCYLFGGQSIAKRNDLRMLNPDTWTWTVVPTFYAPKGRIGHSLCAYEQQLVLYGGWSHYSERLGMRRCYTKISKAQLEEEVKWQSFPGAGDMPKSRRDHATAQLGSSMVVFGGVDTRSRVLKSIRVLDLGTLRWNKPNIQGKPGPGRRCFATLTAVFPLKMSARWDVSMLNFSAMKQEVLYMGFYLFGGQSDSNQDLNDLWVLRCEDAQWQWRQLTALGEAPLPRHAHTASHLRSLLIIVGGRNDQLGGPLSDIRLLHLDSLRWDSILITGVAFQPRWGHVSLVVGSKILILGGMNYQNFMPADLVVLETDQSTAGELTKREEERVSKMNARRITEPASPCSPGLLP
jgi:hypothetical protein